MEPEVMLEFITDNVIWFIVGGVIIVMAIIGYFAEKNVFNVEKEKAGMKVTKDDNAPVVKSVEEKSSKKKEQKKPKDENKQSDLKETEAIDVAETTNDEKSEKKQEESSDNNEDDVWNF